MAARKLITIEGQQRPYTDGEWVVYAPDGSAWGSMRPGARTADDPVKAAREFWGGSTEAMGYLVRGYRIELMSRERWQREIFPQLLGDSPQGGEG
ncbi:hypothetical protein [Streptosporangium sp. CA-115845]|uniref:hypothetical protein n=1 Tax=Streptosporangium sp. CA-115845 TaxID=3240071 RepID=UPI003D8CC6C1